jgi:hypothetical protein
VNAQPLISSESVADRERLRKENPSILNISQPIRPVISRSPRAGLRAGQKLSIDGISHGLQTIPSAGLAIMQSCLGAH